MNTIVNGQSAILRSRDHLLDRLDQQIERSRTVNCSFALLVLNLQKFREINIGFGHTVGDAVLRQVAERIQNVLRPDDRLFHIGNDEFAVVLSDLKSAQVVQMAMVKILQEIERNYEVSGNVLAVNAALGAAVFPDHGDRRASLLKAADAALSLARKSGNCYAIFDSELLAREEKIATLKGKLKSAIENDALLFHYQAQMDLQKKTLSGCEALVRWNDPERGWISPEIFIPVAERSDLIETLTYWSMNVAMREWFAICEGPGTKTPISINLSARLLHSAELVQLVERAMNIWGAQPGALILEVTESAMMEDPDTALRTLSALHDMGVTLSIDDFGTGYSSLAYLKKLPVGELKIDKSFVLNMKDDHQDRMIVKSIIDLAHNLGISVVAEGIENRETLLMLSDMGCDYGQGNYLAKPMPPDELEKWVRSESWNQVNVAGNHGK